MYNGNKVLIFALLILFTSKQRQILPSSKNNQLNKINIKIMLEQGKIKSQATSSNEPMKDEIDFDYSTPVYYKLQSQGNPPRYICLRPNSNLADFPGEAIMTSTNNKLEGVRRKNWWGFSGRKSADADLNARYLNRIGESDLADYVYMFF